MTEIIAPKRSNQWITGDGKPTPRLYRFAELIALALNTGGFDDTDDSDGDEGVSGLGTAAFRDVGTSVNNVVALDSIGLPAVDGSQLTGIDDVSEENPAEVVYVKGDANTDGSLRIIPDLSAETEFEFQLRSNGVWNDTGIVIAASTIYLGRELQVSGGGEYILTKDQSSDIRSLIPHVRFDEVTGTEETVVVPKVSAISTDVIIQPDESGEITSSTIQFTGAAADLVLANALILKTGATAATGTVTLKLHRDSFTEGLFYQRDYPASFFPANSDVTLTTDGLVELLAGQTFYITFECAGTMSLKADVTNTTPYFGGNFYFLTEDTLTPDEFGGALSLAMTDNDDVLTDDDEIVWEVA